MRKRSSFIECGGDDGFSIIPWHQVAMMLVVTKLYVTVIWGWITLLFLFRYIMFGLDIKTFGFHRIWMECIGSGSANVFRLEINSLACSPVIPDFLFFFSFFSDKSHSAISCNIFLISLRLSSDGFP